MIQKKNFILTLDTETCGLSDPIYDIGWQVHDNKGNVVDSYHALVREVFTNGARMTRAHFAKKVFSDYAEMLDGQTIRLVNWSDIVGRLCDSILTYDVSIVAAYNLGFDKKAMRITHELLGNSGPIMPRAAKMLDLWQFACETILNTSSYKRMAIDNGWVSPAGNIKTNAECAFRFITKNVDYLEDHTALSDAIIETEIAARCYATKKRIPYNVINAQPWRIVNA